MMDVYLFERATGRILQRSLGDDAAVLAMTNADVGAFVYIPNISDDTHYLSLATQQVREYPTRPSPTAKFDYATEQWVETP